MSEKNTFSVNKIGGWLYKTRSGHLDEEQNSAVSGSAVILSVTCRLPNVMFNYFTYIHRIRETMYSIVGRRPVVTTFRDSPGALPDKC